MIFVTIPVRTVSEANSHEHWRYRQKRAKTQKSAASILIQTSMHYRARMLFPLVVTLTRIAPRTLDSDNLASSQKHVRDGIAMALGIDDRDPRVEWRYAQRPGGKGEYAVQVCIQQKDTA